MRGQTDTLRTKKRSDFRLACGKCYYSMRRYLLWMSGKYRFAKVQKKERLPYVQFCHETPLLRRLKDVDMQYQYNKIQNLRLAAERLDGAVIMPGETFSYWRLIGKPTYKKGYLDGIVLKNGKAEHGCGGGLCQMSNLIFWMTLHTSLTVVERHRHGYDVFPDSNRTQPFGSGATCYYPYGDLMIANQTDRPFQLNVQVGERNLTGSWSSTRPSRCRYEVVEREHRMQSEWWGGYSRHNQLYRQTWSLDGELLAEELAVENHAMMMYEPFLPDSADGGKIET